MRNSSMGVVLSVSLAIFALAACSGEATIDEPEAAEQSLDSLRGSDAPSAHCPDLCAAVCSGAPEPTIPAGCPIPMCQCDARTQCPDICGAVCSGAPEPTIPAGCPVPMCQCS